MTQNAAYFNEIIRVMALPRQTVTSPDSQYVFDMHRDKEANALYFIPRSNCNIRAIAEIAVDFKDMNPDHKVIFNFNTDFKEVSATQTVTDIVIAHKDEPGNNTYNYLRIKGTHENWIDTTFNTKCGEGFVKVFNVLIDAIMLGRDTGKAVVLVLGKQEVMLAGDSKAEDIEKSIAPEYQELNVRPKVVSAPHPSTKAGKYTLRD